jgi:hypothetical protein
MSSTNVITSINPKGISVPLVCEVAGNECDRGE